MHQIVRQNGLDSIRYVAQWHVNPLQQLFSCVCQIMNKLSNYIRLIGDLIIPI